MIKQQDLKEIGKEKKKGMYRLEFNKNKIKILMSQKNARKIEDTDGLFFYPLLCC